MRNTITYVYYTDISKQAKNIIANKLLNLIDDNSLNEYIWMNDNPFTYDYETQVDILYYQKHKSSFSHVFETLLHPDNIEFSKKLGVYSDMSVCWKAF